MSKVLVIDIETTPHLVYTWGLFNQNISLSQIVKPSEVMCFAGRWANQAKAWSVGGPGVTKKELTLAAWEVLDKCDVLVHYNGKRFDRPHLNREFVEAGLPPPSPYRQVDLYQAVKSQFKFASNKLDHVSQQLKLGKKDGTSFKLWIDCMNGDPKAWAKMLKYNRQDVNLTHDLHQLIKAWVPNHPNIALLDEQVNGCTLCGSTEFFVGAGHRFTQSGKYQRYQCSPAKGGCGKYQTAVRREATTTLRSEPL